MGRVTVPTDRRKPLPWLSAQDADPLAYNDVLLLMAGCCVLGVPLTLLPAETLAGARLPGRSDRAVHRLTRACVREITPRSSFRT